MKDNNTEQESLHKDLDKMTSLQILEAINEEDRKIALAVENSIPSINILITKALPKMEKGGRLFYIGAGTSGRLGVLDASEIPPTFGVNSNIVIGIIAGGDKALRNAVESAEDDFNKSWEDLQQYNINENDTLVGIAASGRTPYVVGGLRNARKNGLLTASISMNENSPIAKEAEIPIEAIVGPEFVTGSTRMKSGTAQKLILNMISTALMIKLGKVKGNRMVDMQLNNNKLIDRGVKMIMLDTSCSYDIAKEKLVKYNSVRKAIKAIKENEEKY